MSEETKAAGSTQPMLTPTALAEILQVKTDKVLTWIRSGELRAYNVAERQSSRPRWRIDAADFEAFKARRASKLPPRRPPWRRSLPAR